MSDAESKEFGECEVAIHKLLDAWVAAGEALTRIHAKRLYRDRYDSFERYTLDRWGFGDAQARRLMAGAGVMAKLTPIGGTSQIPLPTCEAQVRPLTTVPVAKLETVWRKVVADAEGPVTAKLVSRIAKPFQKPTKTGGRKSNTVDTAAEQKTKIVACIARLRALLQDTSWEKEAQAALRKLEWLLR